MKMTLERIREVRGRCEKAPAGPWEWSPSRHLVNAKGVVVVGDDADAFIAYARSDLPDALDDLEDARRTIKYWRTWFIAHPHLADWV